MKKKSKGRHPVRAVRCPYCGALADLRPASEIYGNETRKDLLYVCRNYPACQSYVRASAGSKVPRGPLANGELRHMRILAHRTFDQLWQSGAMPRDAAYRWMADYFCIPLSKAHIGQFDAYRCRELIQKCEGILGLRGKIGERKGGNTHEENHDGISA